MELRAICTALGGSCRVTCPNGRAGTGTQDPWFPEPMSALCLPVGRAPVGLVIRGNLKNKNTAGGSRPQRHQEVNNDRMVGVDGRK